MILLIAVDSEKVNTAFDLSRILSIEKRDSKNPYTAKRFCIYFCFNLNEDYYKLSYESEEERDNKFDEFITAWKEALEGKLYGNPYAIR